MNICTSCTISAQHDPSALFPQPSCLSTLFQKLFSYVASLRANQRVELCEEGNRPHQVAAHNGENQRRTPQPVLPRAQNPSVSNELPKRNGFKWDVLVDRVLCKTKDAQKMGGKGPERETTRADTLERERELGFLGEGD